MKIVPFYNFTHEDKELTLILLVPSGKCIDCDKVMQYTYIFTQTVNTFVNRFITESYWHCIKCSCWNLDKIVEIGEKYLKTTDLALDILEAED